MLKQFKILPKAPLSRFLQVLEAGYLATNPYHSNAHAADMTNSFYFMISKSSFKEIGDVPEASVAAMLVAALAHDVGHFARSNPFLIATRHALTITYNDRSVLENFHAATLIRLLGETYGEESEGGKMQLFALVPAAQLAKDRLLMIMLILGTDTQKHLEDLASFRLRLGTESYDPVRESSDQQQALSVMFRAADISHSAKRWDLHQEWSLRVVQEFHDQGDEEKRLGLPVTPLCDREGFVLSKSQAGFLQFICLPTWHELARFEELLHNSRELQTSQQSSSDNKVARKGTMTHHPRRTVVPPAAHRQSSRQWRSRFNADSEVMFVGAVPGKVVPKLLTATVSDGSRKPIDEESCTVPSAASSKQNSLTSHDAEEREVATPRRWLAEVCLAQCERNLHSWKAQHETEATA